MFGEISGAAFTPMGDELFVGIADPTYASMLQASGWVAGMPHAASAPMLQAAKQPSPGSVFRVQAAAQAQAGRGMQCVALSVQAVAQAQAQAHAMCMNGSLQLLCHGLSPRNLPAKAALTPDHHAVHCSVPTCPLHSPSLSHHAVHQHLPPPPSSPPHHHTIPSHLPPLHTHTLQFERVAPSCPEEEWLGPLPSDPAATDPAAAAAATAAHAPHAGVEGGAGEEGGEGEGGGEGEDEEEGEGAHGGPYTVLVQVCVPGCA